MEPVTRPPNRQNAGLEDTTSPLCPCRTDGTQYAENDINFVGAGHIPGRTSKMERVPPLVVAPIHPYAQNHGGMVGIRAGHRFHAHRSVRCDPPLHPSVGCVKCETAHMPPLGRGEGGWVVVVVRPCLTAGGSYVPFWKFRRRCDPPLQTNPSSLGKSLSLIPFVNTTYGTTVAVSASCVPRATSSGSCVPRPACSDSTFRNPTIATTPAITGAMP